MASLYRSLRSHGKYSEMLTRPLIADNETVELKTNGGVAEQDRDGGDGQQLAVEGISRTTDTSRRGASGEDDRPLDPEGDTASINSFSYTLINISLSDRKSKWKEAALYVSEGEKDAKIYHHPVGYWSKRAFKTLHHSAYYVTHLVASVLLMLLAVIETPLSREGQHPNHQTNKAILSAHVVLEIILFSFFFIDMFLKFVWFGPKRFFTHRRTMVILVILCVMTIEAFVILIRQESHVRLTRALRPIVLMDNHYLYGVRRVMWQVFLCIKPITDVLLLILFFIVFFCLLGYYFFSDVDPSFFSSFWKSFVSLFITMTTSNNPDVMLEAYYEHIYSPLFFVAYLAITFYYLMNVLLAVVYGSFEEEEKKKFKKLFKHKLHALDMAYDLLASRDDDEDDTGICFNDFLMFMHYYQPYTPEWQVLCIFKALHNEVDMNRQQRRLTKDEFHRLYEVRDLKWKQDKEMKIPSQRCMWCFLQVHKFFHGVVKSKAFNIIINLIVLSNLFFLIIYTMVTSAKSDDKYGVLRKILPASYFYISIYIIEIILRIIGLGPYEYFRKKRNISDFTIILISFICLLLETKVQRWIVLAAVRPFKLLRVLRLKRRFRDIGSTTIVLLPRLANIVILLICIYYFFAIIGIELLNGTVYRGCCDNNNTWYDVGSSFSGIYTPNTTDNIPASSDVYYLLNFNTIITSYVTLFVLMVVNNWFIIMEGFASEVGADHGWLVRVYFISFFIVMLVILQVVISFIVDEFKFKVLDTAKKRVCPLHQKTFEHCRCKRYRKKMVTVTLLPGDIEQLETHAHDHRRTFSYLIRTLRQIKLDRDTQMIFIGRRLKTKEDVKRTIFQAEIPEWTNEYYAAKQNILDKGEEITAKMERKAFVNKAKKFLRECFLYFIDWVIE